MLSETEITHIDTLAIVKNNCFLNNVYMHNTKVLESLYKVFGTCAPYISLAKKRTQLPAFMASELCLEGNSNNTRADEPLFVRRKKCYKMSTNLQST